MRSIDADVNRSVLYSRATHNRSPSRAVIIVKSKSAVLRSSWIDSAVSPCKQSLAPEVPSANGARPWSSRRGPSGAQTSPGTTEDGWDRDFPEAD